MTCNGHSGVCGPVDCCLPLWAVWQQGYAFDVEESWFATFCLTVLTWDQAHLKAELVCAAPPAGNTAVASKNASDAAAEVEAESTFAAQANHHQHSSAGPTSSSSPSISQHSATYTSPSHMAQSQTAHPANNHNGHESDSERQGKHESSASESGDHQSMSSSPQSAATASRDTERQQHHPEATAEHSNVNTQQATVGQSRQESKASAESKHKHAASSHPDSSQSRQQAQLDSAWQQSHDSNGSAKIGKRRQSSRDSRHSPQHESVDDEVAGVLHDDTHSDRHPSQAKDPQHWHEPTVLTAICGNPSVSAEAWSEKLQLPTYFAPLSEADEEALVLAVSTPGDYMLSLFRAYAPHNVLTFMQFARRHSLQS